MRRAQTVLAAPILVILAATQSYNLWRREHIPNDFRITIWKPARYVLDGVTPYVGSAAEATYPPLVFLTFAPLALLDYRVACAVSDRVFSRAVRRRPSRCSRSARPSLLRGVSLLCSGLVLALLSG